MTYKPKYKKYKMSIPVAWIKDGDSYLVITTKESEKLFGQSLYGSGKTIKKAENHLLSMGRIITEYHTHRSNELDKWKPFQCGDWSHIGGTWFMIYGIHFYFRYGKNMHGGWYIPFTKLNIGISKRGGKK